MNPDHLSPVNRMDTISYIIGYDYGEGIREQKIDANPQMVYKGLFDALKKDSGLFSKELLNQLIEEYNQELEERNKKLFQEMLERNLTEGRKFLEENRKQPGVFELPSGLQYKILKLGKGPNPAPNDTVTIHYRAMYTDRTTFDMTYDTGPVTIGLNRLVKGLMEGIQLMQPGAIFEFYIPPHIGYGNQNYRDLIPAGSTVIYTIELISVNPSKNSRP